MLPVQIVDSENLHRPRGYSHGIRVPAGSSLLFIAGQVAWDTRGKLVGGDSFTAQFDRALANVLEVIRAAGGTPEGIVSLTIFVTSTEEYLAQRKSVGEVYRARMGKHFPAMTLVGVNSLLEEGAKVEIQGIAALGPETKEPEEPRHPSNKMT